MDQSSTLNDEEKSARTRYYSPYLEISKRSVDIICSVAFFIFFGWLYLLVCVGVLVTSGKPILYSQPRYKKDGKLFRLYKFRSMVADADGVLAAHLASNADARSQWNKYQKLIEDPRITKFGAFIRRTSLDELPQFWNVLIGDMSFIGPRPCMLDQKNLYGVDWKYYCAVRPGITGLWQVSGRNNLTYEHRVQLDVEYVKKLSVRTDIGIAFRTIYVVATGHGSR